MRGVDGEVVDAPEFASESCANISAGHSSMLGTTRTATISLPKTAFLWGVQGIRWLQLHHSIFASQNQCKVIFFFGQDLTVSLPA